jgi:hypothetical protein
MYKVQYTLLGLAAPTRHRYIYVWYSYTIKIEPHLRGTTSPTRYNYTYPSIRYIYNYDVHLRLLRTSYKYDLRQYKDASTNTGDAPVRYCMTALFTFIQKDNDPTWNQSKNSYSNHIKMVWALGNTATNYTYIA